MRTGSPRGRSARGSRREACETKSSLYAKGCHPPYCSPSLVAAEVDKALRRPRRRPARCLHACTGTTRTSPSSVRRGARRAGRERQARRVRRLELDDAPLSRARRLPGRRRRSVRRVQQPLLAGRDGDADLARLPRDDEGTISTSSRATASRRSPGPASPQATSQVVRSPSWDSPANEARRAARERARRESSARHRPRSRSLRAAPAAARARRRGHPLRRRIWKRRSRHARSA